LGKLNYPTVFDFWLESMGVRRGGQEGALDPPWPAKIVCILTFLVENSMFLGVFQSNSIFLPSPGKKSADAHVESINTAA
jgi:hypothetical protein